MPRANKQKNSTEKCIGNVFFKCIYFCSGQTEKNHFFTFVILILSSDNLLIETVMDSEMTPKPSGSECFPP